MVISSFFPPQSTQVSSGSPKAECGHPASQPDPEDRASAAGQRPGGRPEQGRLAWEEGRCPSSSL